MPTELFKIAQPGSKVGFTTTDPAITNATELAAATIAEFDEFTCQITSAVFTPTGGNSGTNDTPGSFCSPAVSTPIPSASTWTVDIEMLQDPHMVDGLSKFLLENDAVEGWVYVSTTATDAVPKFLGHVYFSAAALGGAAATPLTATVSFVCMEKPLAAFPLVVVAAASGEEAA